MKKILLSVALLAATCGASAQKLSYIPYEDNALMRGVTISANGRYVAGSDTGGRAFIYDTQAKQIKYFQSLTSAIPALILTTWLLFALSPTTA